MNIFKKSIIFIPAFLISANHVFAQGIKIQNPLNATDVSTVINKVVDWLIQIGAVAVVLAIVYAGFLFVAAQGKPEEINKAKMTLFWTIIGAMILLGAQIISSVIESTIKQL